MTTKSLDELRKNLPKRELRLVPHEAAAINLRADSDGPKIDMFIPFNRDSVEMWGFTEQIAQGAFKRTIKNAKGSRQDIVSLWNHDASWVLGRQGNDTLTLRETEKGLEATATLDAEDPMHRHFARRVERRDVQGSSFGFETIKDEWRYDDDGTAHRTLLEVRLFEVSPVTFPAYPDSDAGKRSVLDIACVKAGVDLNELADLLQQAKEGKVPLEQHDALRSWVARLEGFLPSVTPTVLVDYAAKFAYREAVARGARLVA